MPAFARVRYCSGLRRARLSRFAANAAALKGVPMISRRSFLRAGTTSAVALTAFTNESLARVAAAGARTAGLAPADVASR